MQIRDRSEETHIKVILTQLPHLIETEPEIHDFILRVTRDHYSGKQETGSRRDRMIEELKRDRETQMEKWEAYERRWAAWEKKWADEREGQEKKWEENQRVINQVLNEIRLQNQKYDAAIGALGARWGLKSEAAFRMVKNPQGCVVKIPFS